MLNFEWKHIGQHIELSIRRKNEGAYAFVRCVDGVWRTSDCGLVQPEVECALDAKLANIAYAGHKPA